MLYWVKCNNIDNIGAKYKNKSVITLRNITIDLNRHTFNNMNYFNNIELYMVM